MASVAAAEPAPFPDPIHPFPALLIPCSVLFCPLLPYFACPTLISLPQPPAILTA